jgi:hypothetical protein
MEDMRKNDIREDYRIQLRTKKEQMNMQINRKQANKVSKKFFHADMY